MDKIRTLFSRERESAVLVVMLVITALFVASTVGGRFFTAGNFQSMAVQVSEFGFLAIAMGLAMLTGGIDLSIVAAAALSSIVGATVLSGAIIPLDGTNSGLVMAVAVVATLVTAVLCGTLNGLLIAKVSIPPILATLGTMILFTGIGTVITKGQSVPVKVPEFAQLAVVTVGGIPLIFLITAVGFVVVGLMLWKTRQGRRITLFGENNVALKFSGAKTERTIVLTYALIGLMVGIAAIIMLSRVNSARVGFGESYLLQAILVVVLAGFNPYGGKGRIVNVAIALVLLQMLQSAFTMMQFTPFAKNLVWGAMLLLVMVVNHVIARIRITPRASIPPPASTPTPQPATTAGS